MFFNKKLHATIESLQKDRDELRTEVLGWMRKYNDLTEEFNFNLKRLVEAEKEHCKTLEELGKDKDRILYLLTAISNMRQEWIREHSEEFEDGTDIVTPFDHIFYSMRG